MPDIDSRGSQYSVSVYVLMLIFDRITNNYGDFMIRAIMIISTDIRMLLIYSFTAPSEVIPLLDKLMP